ncbi:hypothetical protein ALC56_03524, partial [Trachymyrmex septentrionalis]
IMRTYKRKTDEGNISKNIIEFAWKEVILEEKSIRSSGLKYNILYKILHRYVTKLKAAEKNSSQVSNIRLTHVDYIKTPLFVKRRKLIYTPNTLVEYIKKAADIYYGLTSREIRKLAYNCLKMEPSDIWNLITVAVAVSAIGNIIPHFFIFLRVNYKDHFVQGGPFGSEGDDANPGWMKEEHFIKYYKFIRHVRPSKERPVLLLLDNHKSYLSIEALDYRQGRVKMNTAFNGEFVLLQILNLVNVNKHYPLRAECYFEMPREIILKKAVISVRSTDNACFAWSVISTIPVQRPLLSYHFHRDDDCIAWFARQLQDLAHRVKNIISTNVPIKNVVHVNSTKDENENNFQKNCIKLCFIDSFKFLSTLGEYSDLYLKTDVLLLADIFENFCESCIASYGLDLAHYTFPSFTWNAMMKYTRVRFKLLTDIDMIMFIERGIRGLNECSGKYAQANNKYMRSYDLLKLSSYLIHYDVNNLYNGWTMCVANFNVSAIAPDSSIGYILEVDLEYSQHLYDRLYITDTEFDGDVTMETLADIFVTYISYVLYVFLYSLRILLLF